MHAVEQYIKRWAPEKTQDEAIAELNSLLSTSTTVGKTPLGDQIYASGHRPKIRMVVKDQNCCVTVLPPPNEDHSLDEYWELIEESNELREKSEEMVAQHQAEIQSKIDELEKEFHHLNSERQKAQDKYMEVKAKLANLKTLLLPVVKEKDAR